MNQRTLIISVTALIAATTLGAALWYVSMPKDINTPSVTQTTNQTEKTPTVASSGETNISASGETGVYATTQEDLDTSKWKTYRNEKYGFEIRYPEHVFTVKEMTRDYYDEAFSVDFIKKGNRFDDNGKMAFRFYQIPGVKDPSMEECVSVKVDSKDAILCSPKESFEIDKNNFYSITGDGVCLHEGKVLGALFNKHWSKDGERGDSFFLTCDSDPLTGKVFQEMYRSIQLF